MDLSPIKVIVLFETTFSFVYIPFPVCPFTVSILPPLLAFITAPSEYIPTPLLPILIRDPLSVIVPVLETRFLICENTPIPPAPDDISIDEPFSSRIELGPNAPAIFSLSSSTASIPIAELFPTDFILPLFTMSIPLFPFEGALPLGVSVNPR